MNTFTIKDLENLSGIKAHTIRIWEQRYSFLKPQRTTTNIRFYSNDELKTILNVSLLNKYGFKISDIDKMKEDEIKERLYSLPHTEAEQERIINDLIKQMIEFNVDQFELILEYYLAEKGIEQTLEIIIFPFLEKIGILWLTNHINPAQEHLVTNIIRQKIVVGIEKTAASIRLDKLAILFLPEGEHHELGLLYIYYLLKKKGVRVLYLGADVPLKDIHYVTELKKPDFLQLHLTSVAYNFNFEKFLTNLASAIPHTNIHISGPLTLNYKKNIPSNVHFKKTLGEVINFVNTLS